LRDGANDVLGLLLLVEYSIANRIGQYVLVYGCDAWFCADPAADLPATHASTASAPQEGAAVAPSERRPSLMKATAAPLPALVNGSARVRGTSALRSERLATPLRCSMSG